MSTARRSVQQAQDVTGRLEATTKATLSNSTATDGHLASALDAVTKHDDNVASQEIVLAQGSNRVVLQLLEQSLGDVTSLRGSLTQAETDLAGAQEDIRALTKEIAKVTEQGAKDRAIVDRVNWGFGLGAFIYGFQRILTFGFWGALIIGAILLVLMAIGGPFAAFAINLVRSVINLLRKK